MMIMVMMVMVIVIDDDDADDDDDNEEDDDDDDGDDDGDADADAAADDDDGDGDGDGGDGDRDRDRDGDGNDDGDGDIDGDHDEDSWFMIHDSWQSYWFMFATVIKEVLSLHPLPQTLQLMPQVACWFRQIAGSLEPAESGWVYVECIQRFVQIQLHQVHVTCHK